MEKNESKKLYINAINKLSYDFSLEEIVKIYQLVQWKWHNSPVVHERIKAMIEENRRLEL